MADTYQDLILSICLAFLKLYINLWIEAAQVKTSNVHWLAVLPSTQAQPLASPTGLDGTHQDPMCLHPSPESFALLQHTTPSSDLTLFSLPVLSYKWEHLALVFPFSLIPLTTLLQSLKFRTPLGFCENCGSWRGEEAHYCGEHV